MSEGKFDPHRRLCPDGACIGVIGDDARCRVCGRSASGGGAPADFVAPRNEGNEGNDDADDAESENTGDGEVRDGDAKTLSAAGFDPNRRLCPDGGCIGVIGPDGICTVCGQKAES